MNPILFLTLSWEYNDLCGLLDSADFELYTAIVERLQEIDDLTFAD